MWIDRRTLLRSGGALLATGALAGCQGDTPEDGTTDADGQADEGEDEADDADTEEPRDPLVLFAERIREETDVTIRGLRTTDDMAVLEYESQTRIETEPGSGEITDPGAGEIGTISEIYASVVDGGWEIGMLAATVRDSASAFYQFEAEREVAIDWARDEVSDSEFGRTIEESLRWIDPILREFSSRAQSDVEIRVQTVEADGRTLRIEYESPNTYGSSESFREITNVGALYANVVRQGWLMIQLSGRFTDGQGDTYTFSLDDETALAWANGEIEDADLQDAIVETIEEAE